MNRQLIKKYKYLLTRKITSSHNILFRKLKSWVNNDHSKLDLSVFGVTKLPYPVRWEEINQYNKLVLEIGSGHGELLEWISRDKDVTIIGFEITKEFTRRSYKRISQRNNAFIFHGDGYLSSRYLFAKESINKVYILFPDPWHKKKHNKRRPITSSWFKEIHNNLKTDGEIFFASDWEEYFDFVKNETEKVVDLYSIETGEYNPDKFNLPHTHYYKKWLKIGRKFQFISLKKR